MGGNTRPQSFESAHRIGETPVPAPVRPPASDELPHALTFFLSVRERREVLRILSRADPDRRRALLRLLGLEPR